MVVMKFGGSSVATSAALARVCAIVAAERRRKIVVVSALGGVTDALLAAAAQAGAGDLAGALEGLRGISPGGRVEFMPYAVTQAQFRPGQEGNPFETGHRDPWPVRLPRMMD